MPRSRLARAVMSSSRKMLPPDRISTKDVICCPRPSETQPTMMPAEAVAMGDARHVAAAGGQGQEKRLDAFLEGLALGLLVNEGFHDGLAEHDEREHHDGAEHGHFGGMLHDDELIQQHADGDEEVQPLFERGPERRQFGFGQAAQPELASFHVGDPEQARHRRRRPGMAAALATSM